jgi:phospholipid/cholesterol/gamma-HCH transport system substrate-binding protein
MAAALARPNVVVRLVTLIAVALIAVVLVSVVGGGRVYVLKLQLANASGLRPGSQVLLGGVSVGTVDSLRINRSGLVVAELHLNPDQVHVGRGASAGLVAANLLGEEYVALKPGDRSAPLPSGTALPQSATTQPTELDQIVGVLNGGTRARLAILLREAGVAVAGRRSDIGAILRQFPLSLTAATTLLRTMVQNTHTLADLVARSDQFISRMNAFGGPLKQVIGAAAGASETLAAQSRALGQTVRAAPTTLTTIRTFVLNLGNTAGNLRVPVGELARDARPLNKLLAAVKPFTAAAVPTLDRAAAVAPTLTRLARRATPSVAAAVPMLASLQRIAGLAQPLSAWIGLSAQDIVGIMNGWSRAIQFRDGISHVFNANLYLNPSIVLNIADQGASPMQKCQNLLDVLNPGLLRGMALLNAALGQRRTGCSVLASAPARTAPVPGPHRPTAPPPPAVPARSPASGPIAAARTGLGKVLGGVTGALGAVSAGLGKTIGQAGSTLQSGAGQAGSSLHNLLGYLFGK